MNEELEIDPLDPFIDRIMAALGEDDMALVCNTSKIKDFFPDDQEIANLAETLGIKINRNDKIVDVARRLKEIDNP